MSSDDEGIGAVAGWISALLGAGSLGAAWVVLAGTMLQALSMSLESRFQQVAGAISGQPPPGPSASNLGVVVAGLGLGGVLWLVALVAFVASRRAGGALRWVGAGGVVLSLLWTATALVFGALALTGLLGA